MPTITKEQEEENLRVTHTIARFLGRRLDNEIVEILTIYGQ